MKILYEDEALLVCFKEAGLPVQSRQVMQKDLESMLKSHLRETHPEAVSYLGVVHRLDQPVEGLVVFAKTPEAAAKLSEQVNDGRMEKVYEALVSLPEEAKGSGTLCDYLLRDGRTNLSKVVPEGTKGSKLARLEYEILDPIYIEGTRFARARIHLLTGRHHQIRAQLANGGMPILGDRKYAGRQQATAGELPCRFPALCAMELSFDHPGSGERLHFTAEQESWVRGFFDMRSGQKW